MLVVVVASGCVGKVLDPAGDADGSLDITEAGVDFREEETRFWVGLATAPGDSSTFTAVWCFEVGDQPCRLDEDPSSSHRVRLVHPSLRYEVDFGGGFLTCGGFGHFDGDRTWSVTLNTRCLDTATTIRFNALVSSDGVTAADSTSVSSTVVVSE